MHEWIHIRFRKLPIDKFLKIPITVKNSMHADIPEVSDPSMVTYAKVTLIKDWLVLFSSVLVYYSPAVKNSIQIWTL